MGNSWKLFWFSQAMTGEIGNGTVTANNIFRL
jgi:hypothetical protein